MANGTFQWNSKQYAKANGLQAMVGEQLIRSIRIPDNASILDAGCGSGNLTFEIAEMVPNGHVTAIDLSEQKCKEDLNCTRLQNITFVVCGLNDISYENEFDIIFSNSVLHWIIAIEDSLTRLHTALRPGGQIALQFPLLNKHHPLIMYADRVIDKMHLQQYYREWTFPWFAPTEESFRNILAKVNFKNVSIKKEKTDFEFNSANAVFDHFQSVGLKLYADVLPGKLKEQFMDAVLQEIRNVGAGKMILHYERLFAYGEK